MSTAKHNAWDFDDDDFYELDSQREQFEFLLRYATLAPSTHNTQPWTFAITPLGVNVYADFSRRMKVADPEDRELLMSLGAAIANLRVAAAHFGFESSVSFPVEQSDDGPAFVALRETCAPDEKLASLFRAIRVRRTNRHPFDRDPADPQLLGPLLDFIDDHANTFSIVLPKDALRTADLVAMADKIQMDDKRFREELAKWLRSSSDGATDGLPADVVGFPGSVAGAAPLILRHLDFGSWQAYRDHDLASSAAALIVVSSYDDPLSLILAGEELELLLLTLTRAGFQYSFLNAPVQLTGLRDRVATLTRAHRPPQLIIRVGCSRAVKTTTPRRPLEEVLR